MKNNTFALRNCVAAGILAGVFAAPAVSGHELFRPYLGVGAQVLKLELDKAYGGPLFNKGVVPGGMAFVGARVGEFMGVELGYNYFSRKRDTVLGSDDIFPGSGRGQFDFLGDTFTVFRTRVLIKEVNVGITGYLPLKAVSCLLDQTELFATLGVSRTSVKLRLLAIADDNGEVVNNPNHKFAQKKTIPIARVGVQQNITENINLNVFSEWKRLKAFNNMRAPTTNSPGFALHLKNSVSYGLRLSYIF